MNLLISQHREMTMFSPLLRLNLLRWITLSHRSYCKLNVILNFERQIECCIKKNHQLMIRCQCDIIKN